MTDYCVSCVFDYYTKNNPKSINVLTLNKEFMDYLRSKFPLLINKPTISEYRYWFQHKLTNYPKCPVCGKDVKWNNRKRCYYKYCCHYCSTQDPELKQIKKQIFLDKYGVTCGYQTDLARKMCHSEKAKQKYVSTCLKHYGATNPNKNKDVRKKYTDTMNRIYGGILWQSEKLKKKSIQTNIRKYGCQYTSQCREILTKIGTRYFFDGIKFDSALEIFYYCYLKNNNVNFEYYHKIPQPYVSNGREHYYYVDFYLPTDKRYIEIKSTFFFENGILINPFDRTCDTNSIQKFNLMKKYNVEVLTEIELIKLGYKNNRYIRKYSEFLKQNMIKYYCPNVYELNRYTFEEAKKDAIEKGTKLT